jgi:hypothetical protein
LDCYCPIITVLNRYCLDIGQLLSNRYCLDLGLLLSNHYCLKLLLFRPWTVTVQPLLFRPWAVTVEPLLPGEVAFRPLLRFLTTSEVLGSVSSEVGLIGKLRHGATSPLKEGEPSSAPKTVEITHQ